MIIERVHPPHRYDIAPFGTICKVKTALRDESIIYLQLSLKEDNPRWEEFGVMPAYFTEKHMRKELSSLLKY